MNHFDKTHKINYSAPDLLNILLKVKQAFDKLLNRIEEVAAKEKSNFKHVHSAKQIMSTNKTEYNLFYKLADKVAYRPNCVICRDACGGKFSYFRGYANIDCSLKVKGACHTCRPVEERAKNGYLSNGISGMGHEIRSIPGNSRSAPLLLDPPPSISGGTHHNQDKNENLKSNYEANINGQNSQAAAHLRGSSGSYAAPAGSQNSENLTTIDDTWIPKLNYSRVINLIPPGLSSEYELSGGGGLVDTYGKGPENSAQVYSRRILDAENPFYEDTRPDSMVLQEEDTRGRVCCTK